MWTNGTIARWHTHSTFFNKTRKKQGLIPSPAQHGIEWYHNLRYDLITLHHMPTPETIVYVTGEQTQGFPLCQQVLTLGYNIYQELCMLLCFVKLYHHYLIPVNFTRAHWGYYTATESMRLSKYYSSNLAEYVPMCSTSYCPLSTLGRVPTNVVRQISSTQMVIE